MQTSSIKWLKEKWYSDENITDETFEIAKEIHKQEIIDAHHCGRAFENKYPNSLKTYNDSAEHYYNQTYKK